MIRSILIVCTGNICRSPIAEELMRQKLREAVVYSAGLHALCGACVDRLAVDVAWAAGIDICGHRARSVSTWMLEAADLVLTMDRAQMRAIEANYPEAKHKVWRLGEFGNYDIPDPHQKKLADFQESLLLITRGVEDWSRYLLASKDKTDDKQQIAATPL